MTLLVILGGILAGTAAGVWLARRGWSRPFAKPEPGRTLARAAPGAQPPHARGGDDAVVTLEEFGDFECPPCARLHPELKKIEVEYGPRLRVVFTNFPLDEIHDHASEAARAAEAAALQGKFWEMHDTLYEERDEWSVLADARPQFVEYARRLGLDADRFARDMDAPQTKERVELDKRRGESADISATPTLFVNGREIPPGAMSPAGIRAAIDAALR